MGIDGVPGVDFPGNVVEIVVLDERCIRACCRWCRSDVVAAHHIGGTDSRHAGNQGLEVVKLLRGQPLGDSGYLPNYINS